MNTEVAKPSAEQDRAETSGKPTDTAPAAHGHPMPAFLRQPVLVIAVLALALLAWQWLETRSRLSGLEAVLASRLSQGDTVAQEARTLAKQGQESLQSLQSKVGGLEAKLAESQSQQMALDAMYQEMARSRDDRLVSEVEQTVNIAAQQLQLAGNVQAALAALQNADARLSGANRPQLLVLRKAVARDMQRLKALPIADVPGMALRLESVITGVDDMPLAFAAEPRSESKSEKAKLGQGFWAELGRELWGELKQLVRVERLDRPDPGLLAPDHAFFLRENLKLRLVNARLSLLQRDGKSFRDDTRQARLWIERYFDTRSPSAVAALSALKQLGEADISSEPPTLNESLAALRTLKAAGEKGKS
ncbi:MAG: uroporphyrinogen-III C-methyltransferase [Rhodocyclaceae bacterium]|nr:uroporphyrinogen-III C-methyltransferase [Rhodocyclaceae bacterium]